MYAVLACGVVLVCTDSEYLAYFNSFYGESAAFLGVLAFVLAGLAAARANRPSWPQILAVFVAGCLLAGSKPQNAVLGVVAALWMMGIFRGERRLRWIAATSGLLMAGFAGFVVTRAVSPESNLFNAIYDRVLPNSLDPPQSLIELGLRPETVKWTNQRYWDIRFSIPSADIYPGRATPLRLAAFYLRHPALDLRMATQALTFNNDVPYLGNYTKQSGFPCRTRTTAFTEYDRARRLLANIWFLLLLVFANLVFALRLRDRVSGFLAALACMVAVAFLLGGFYDNEPGKHLFTFNLLFDVLLFADISVTVAWATRQAKTLKLSRLAGPAVFGSRMQVAFGVCLAILLGIALRSDVIGKTSPAGITNTSDLASFQPATQSSTLPGTTASAAVDGNIDGNFFHGSVAHTREERSPWWQVDLGATAEIGSIAIWNRTDCCTSRLHDYWIFVSDDPFRSEDTPETLCVRARTWKGYFAAPPEPVTHIGTGGIQGRYVRVQLAGTGYLGLAEVQIWRSGPDLALGKTADQSSNFLQYPAGGASLAVDGNLSGDFFKGSVTATDRDAYAWWQVALGASHELRTLLIWNRTDCCQSRLADYWIFLSNEPFTASDTPETLRAKAGVWSRHQIGTPDPSVTVHLPGVHARYARIQLNAAGYLSLAGFQAFGK